MIKNSFTFSFSDYGLEKFSMITNTWFLKDISMITYSIYVKQKLA